MAFSEIVKRLEVPNPEGLSSKELFLNNEDLKVVPEEKRTWKWWNFVNFWIADSFNINTWQIAATGVQAGLSWWVVWVTVWAGYFIAATFIVLMARIGGKYNISFPVTARASFGIWGSYWPVLNRVVMACVWYGVQGWLGGECVQIMIQAIWPQVAYMHNGIPNSGTSTYAFMCFFLFSLVSAVFIWFPVYQIRHLFTVKACIVPVAGIAFLIWAIKKAGGIGPVIHLPSTISGSTYSWAVISSLMNCIANFATLIVNAPDFSRFARKRSDAVWSQLITIPTGFAVTSFIGIIVSSSSTIINGGETLWSPLDVLKLFLNGASSGARCGIFFIAFAFAVAQIGTNIAANSISAGTDMTALFPRFINIRRGGYICATIGFAMCPWNLLSSSNKFTSYLSAYTVFLSAIAGVMLSDYYFVRKGYLIIEDLYTFRKGSTYMYWMGVSWRGFLGYFCGIMINMVGFVGDVGSDTGVTVPIGATYLYNWNFFGGIIVSSLTYYLACYFCPVPGMMPTFRMNRDEAVLDSRSHDEEDSYDYPKNDGYSNEEEQGKNSYSTKTQVF